MAVIFADNNFKCIFICENVVIWFKFHQMSVQWMNFQWAICTIGSSKDLAPNRSQHYNDVIMGAIASQITSLTIVYSIVYSDADERKHESSASLAFVWGIHRWPVNSPHKWPVTQKMFPFDDVIMNLSAFPSFKVAQLLQSCYPDAEWQLELR